MTAENTKTPPPPATVAKGFKEETVGKVLEKINTFKANGELRLPGNYSPENALKSAWLILQDTVDKNGNPVLDVCTPASIANSLLDMVIKGLNPVKKQCYFIAYGKELSCDPSYFGQEVVAKRVGHVKDFKPFTVYEGDEFEYEVDYQTGLVKILKHIQTMDNKDHEKVKGAYCIIIYEDGTIDAEVMSIKQIRQAWAQGQTKGGSPAHKNFTDEMANKSVIGRACKKIINGTDDADLFKEDEDRPDPVTAGIQQDIKSGANKNTLSIASPPPRRPAVSQPKDYVQEEQPEQPAAALAPDEETAPY